jgi:primosomal protein N' (replication factor Y)
MHRTLAIKSPRPYARVAFDLPLPRLFDYLAPADCCDHDIGCRVLAPFGKQTRVGILVALTEHSDLPDAQLRALTAIDRDTPGLSPLLMALGRFASDYYQYPLGPVLLAILPPALRETRFRRPPPAAYALTPTGEAQLTQLSPRAHAQQRLAAQLRQGPMPRTALSGLEAPLRAWLKAGWVQACAIPLMPAPTPIAPPLTSEQAVALNHLREAPAGFGVHLLFGVTGSGKTEIYLRRAAEVMANGLQVLVLVPEIHLTPQLLARFQNRFPDRRIVALHSGLNDGERLTAWLDCAEGRADLLLGTRLAAFSPLDRLGLIIVDEEHDPSYKQSDGLRYSGRDIAIRRAQMTAIPILLGSATPSLESWHNAQRGRYQRIDLLQRAHPEAHLPRLSLIDSRADRPRQGLTRALTEAIDQRLQRGEQSLVFINRRGYAPVLLCPACGHTDDCPRCSSHRVLHRHHGTAQLRCHLCGLAGPMPEQCPKCGSHDLRAGGHGTQRIEETLAERFPNARILRVDRDTTARRGAFADMRQAIETGAIDILVGTQILAKGHDFPRLTLVGVLGADYALQAPDFRAGERLFAQLMQVAGRAGRAATPGEVIVQTAWPRHPLYAALAAHDFPSYARFSLRERQVAGFPPYRYQALLRADARSMTEAMAFLESAQQIAPAPETIALFDPVPAIVPRIARRERAQMLVQSASRRALQTYLGTWVAALHVLGNRTVRWSIDVDPIEL